MSPNRVFDRSFELIRKEPEILRRYGDSVKAYGRDHGKLSVAPTLKDDLDQQDQDLTLFDFVS